MAAVNIENEPSFRGGLRRGRRNVWIALCGGVDIDNESRACRKPRAKSIHINIALVQRNQFYCGAFSDVLFMQAMSNIYRIRAKDDERKFHARQEI